MRIFNFHIQRNNPRGGPGHYPAGRVGIEDGQLHHLEDYYGIIGNVLPAGEFDESKMDQLLKLRHGSYLHAVPAEQDLAPKPQKGSEGPAVSSKFEYLHDAQSKPRQIEFRGGAAYMDGKPLESRDLRFMLRRAKSGAGVIRHPMALPEQVAKMEEAMKQFSTLKKDDQPQADQGILELEHALGLISQVASGGTVEPEAFQHAVTSIRHHSYIDPMTYSPDGIRLGNQRSWDTFRQKARPGVYVSMDGNSLKSVNDQFGHDVGNDVIKHFGRILREAMDETIGSEQSKLFRAETDPSDSARGVFRSGGDEFVAWVPTYDDAAKFVRAVRRKLEELPPVQGVHRVSMAFGFGENPAQSDEALLQAKRQKYTPETQGAPEGERVRAFEPGQEPCMVYSLVPGHHGPIPLDSSLAGIDLGVHHPESPPPTAPSGPIVASSVDKP